MNKMKRTFNCLFAHFLSLVIFSLLLFVPNLTEGARKMEIRLKDRWLRMKRGETKRAAYHLDEWEPYQRLTYAGGHSWLASVGARPIAVCGDTIHITWYDERNGNDDIYYKRSIDRGNTWGPDIQITTDSAYQAMPTIAVSGSTVHIFWTDERHHPGRIRECDIYYRRSTDNGTTWLPETLLCTHPNGEYGGWNPCAAVSGDTVHLVWEDDRNGDDLIHYKRSTDAGRTWTQDLPISSCMGDWLSSIAVWGQNIHMVCENFWQNVIYYRRSTNGGQSWQPIVSFPRPCMSYFPSVAVSHETVYAVFTDCGDSSFNQVFFRRSLTNGDTWEPERMITYDRSHTWSAAVAASGPNVHITRMLMTYYHIWYHRSTDAGLIWEPGVEISNLFRMQCDKSNLALSDSTVHVLFDGNIPDSAGFYEIYYRRNQGGNPTGFGSSKPVKTQCPPAWRIEPNPLIGSKAFIRSFFPEPVEITFHNSLGRPIYKYYLLEINQTPVGPINLEFLPPGLYFVRFETKNRFFLQKLIVHR